MMPCTKGGDSANVILDDKGGGGFCKKLFLMTRGGRPTWEYYRYILWC